MLQIYYKNMVLTIDTGLDPYIQVSLESKGKKVVKKIKAERSQAEKLLPTIEALFQREQVTWKKIKLIRVNDEGGSFTSLRIGVLTANALAYALHIPIEAMSGSEVYKFKGGQAVKPRYQSEPNIGTPKKRSWG